MYGMLVAKAPLSGFFVVIETCEKETASVVSAMVLWRKTLAMASQSTIGALGDDQEMPARLAYLYIAKPENVKCQVSSDRVG